MKNLLLIISILNVFCFQAQTVEGFDLSLYPAEPISIKKKSPIKWSTNPFKNRTKEIKEGYEIGDISFAGNYITVLWNKGKDTAEGVMINPLTGNIYKMPFTPSNTSNKCQEEEDIFDRYLFLPNSRLLVTALCNKTIQKNQTKLRQVFYFFLWNESSKKFNLIKSLTKEKIR
jgi:hypothetical protein